MLLLSVAREVSTITVSLGTGRQCLKKTGGWWSEVHPGYSSELSTLQSILRGMPFFRLLFFLVWLLILARVCDMT